jgi:hypothetical protein
MTLQKSRESRKRNVGYVVLYALGIEFRALLRDTDSAQKINDEPVPGADALRKPMALRSQEHAAIELRRRKPLPLQASDRLNGRGVSHPEPTGNIRGARLAAARQEIVDQFDIVLENCTSLRRTCLFKPPRLNGLDRQLGRRRWRFLACHQTMIPLSALIRAHCHSKFEYYISKSIGRGLIIL